LSKLQKVVDPETVRLALRQWTTGVTIVSSCHNGYQHGMTVSSFTSVALSPPLVMISLQREARTHALIVESGVFGITILAESQQAISERFAGHTADDEDRFAGLESFTLITGAPFLKGGLAFLDCKLINSQVIGEQTVFFGEILALDFKPVGRPLVYHDRRYHGLNDI
jgi:flavin reductase (DIM6/NTAB) family NADH-FMN oxidoreductase RutF